MPYTDLARLLVGTAILAFGAWTDWRWRRAPNALWLAMLGGAAVILVADAVVAWPTFLAAWPYLVGALALAALFYGLWYVGLLAGGADAKALMAIAVLAPFPPLVTTTVPLFQSPFPASVVVFMNALFAFLVVPLGYFVWNAAHGHFTLLGFLGVKRDLEHVDRGHYWLMDRVSDEGELERHYFASRRAYDLEEQKERLRAKGVTRAWVTPKVPFLIPLTVGYVATWTVGDVLFGVLSAIM